MAYWQIWNGADNSTAGTCASYSSDNAWETWTTTTTASSATTVWISWITSNAITCNSNAVVVTTSEPYEDRRTPEQREADAARIAAERAEVLRRANEQAALRKAATARARALLLSMLNTRQREQLHQHEFFDVIAKNSKKRYRIHQGTHGNVRLLDDSDREVTRYCGQPNGVPTEDAMLAQKLQIEHDEAEFIRLANATRMVA